jgi:protein-S-isoprenylcysteine O-methyltransferase Ste14
MPHARWWKGTRGEWYVVAQVALFVLVIFGPRAWPGWRPLRFPDPRLWSIAGILLLVAGGTLTAAGALWLGRRNLTALPHPKDEGTLVDTGPFRLARHPMYGGGILMAFGWGLLVRGPLTILYAILLVAFVAIKSRREERWLLEKFSGYEAYQTRTRRLIPFVY